MYRVGADIAAVICWEYARELFRIQKTNKNHPYSMSRDSYVQDFNILFDKDL